MSQNKTVFIPHDGLITNTQELAKFSCVRKNYFGEALKEARVKKNKTQKEASALLDITHSQWSLYELGKAKPNLDMILQIALSLDIDALDLLDNAIRKSTYYQDKNISKMSSELLSLEDNVLD